VEKSQNMELEQQQKFTVYDCITSDMKELERIQQTLDLIIGHNFAGEALVYYRGRKFYIRRAARSDQNG
jgi:hypothetical protein